MDLKKMIESDKTPTEIVKKSTVAENMSVSLKRLAPEIVPKDLRSSEDLYKDLVKAINDVYDKYGAKIHLS